MSVRPTEEDAQWLQDATILVFELEPEDGEEFSVADFEEPDEPDDAA